MPKSNLTLEDIEKIKKSKGILSASEVQRQYNIGWSRLKKLWNGESVAQDSENITKQELAQPAQQDLTPVAQQEKIQREIERVTAPQKEIVVEDFFARLGQLEAKMERQTTQMERQTELMQNILDSLDAVSNIESDTQSILEKENTESYTLQDIGRSVQEYTDFTKTLVYCAITGFAVWQVLCKTWKHVDKGTSPVPAGSTAAVPIAPVSTPTRPSLFKKTPDPFQMA